MAQEVVALQVAAVQGQTGLSMSVMGGDLLEHEATSQRQREHMQHDEMVCKCSLACCFSCQGRALEHACLMGIQGDAMTPGRSVAAWGLCIVSRLLHRLSHQFWMACAPKVPELTVSMAFLACANVTCGVNQSVCSVR